MDKLVKHVINPLPVTEGAGVKLKRSIGIRGFNRIDPFLLFDHFASEYPENYLAGFPMHPHRGIETVTYMLDGKVEHKDTLGSKGTIYPGDMQWMTSGGGIMHEEMPKPYEDKMEGFQLWVNLPAAQKMTPPCYREVKAGDIPTVKNDDGVTIRVLAGEYDGTKGAISEIYIQPIYWDIEIPSGKTFETTIPADHNTISYLYRGAIHVDERNISSLGMLVYNPVEKLSLRADEKGARMLLMSGKPLNEPVARYGPFVMNTKEEIEQALEDLRTDNFVWKEGGDYNRNEVTDR